MYTDVKDCQYYMYSMLTSFEKAVYYKKIYEFLDRLAWEYPSFKQWYLSIFEENKEIKLEREIIICEKELTIAGIAILKASNFEKKICTLRVGKKFQKQGIGHRLMELSFEWLQDELPMITMNKMKQYQFQSLLNYYGFGLEQAKRNYYHVFSTELVYNGVLPEKKVFFNKIELLDIKTLYKKFVRSGSFDFNKFLEECINKWYKNENCRTKEMIQH